MKRIALAAIVTAAAALGMIGPAGAQGVVIGAGPGGVYVGNGYHRHHHHWRHHYDYARCRTVVRSHINRYGERVSVRRRVCD